MSRLLSKLKFQLDLLEWNLKSIWWFIQRGRRGWADCDSWGYFSYNAQVNRDVLKHLKKIKNGIPNSMFDIDEPRNPTDEEVKVAEKKWDTILDDMIFAFDQIVQLEGNLIGWYPNRTDSQWDEFRSKYPETRLQTQEEAERMKHGMQLFIDNYFHLWD